MDPIKELLHRYADAVCRFDPEQWTNTWAPNGLWEMPRRGRIEGREAIGETWSQIMSGIPAVFHVYFNGTAELDDSDGTGTGRWYVGEFLALDTGTIAMYGYYDDEYVLVDGEWLFLTRTLTPLYRGPADMSGQFMMAASDTAD